MSQTQAGVGCDGVELAVILVGGLGTRLRAVLGDLPKALAPVLGRPFLAYQLAWLRDHGFSQVILCTGYGHERIQEVVGDGAAWQLQVRYSVEEQPLGTGGALRQAQPLLTETFLAMNGDTYFATAVSGLCAEHAATAAKATVALVEVPTTSRFGAVVLDRRGHIRHFAEKSRSGQGLINDGLYVLEPEIIDQFPAQTPLSLEREVFPQLVRRRLLRGCVLSGYHIDIGTPESYAQFAGDVPGLIQSGEMSF